MFASMVICGVAVVAVIGLDHLHLFEKHVDA
jgi:hypothetical protein